jgi:hypothetical protein
MLTKAGQEAQSDEELAQMKSDAWKELLTTRTLGYFALLRNLRNIISQSPECVDLACEMLTDERLIEKSKVLPFRFTTAYEEVKKLESNSIQRKVIVALDEALNKSIVNVPKFTGETLVVIDTSGSMSGKPSDIASLFGAMIVKVNQCDVMTFDNSARYKNYNPVDSVLTIRDGFKFAGGGTNFQDIFNQANKRYDRVIILSDMQGWVGYTTPVKEFNDYKEKFKCNPYIYSWDLEGLSTLQFPESKVFCLSGFSDKVFDIMKYLESDKQELLNRINQIQL